MDGFAQKNDLFSNAAGKGQHTFWGDDMDAFMIRDFVKALLQGEKVPVTGEDGLKAAQVALAAYESAKLGQPVAM